MTSHSKLFQAAKWYLESPNFCPIAVRKNKKPLGKWSEFQKRKPTFEEIKATWSKTPQANVAIVTGAISGITVVDVDTAEGVENLSQFLPDSLEAPTVDTPGGGYHIYFQHVPGIPNKARIINGVDVRNDGGYVLAPPSVNGGGKAYKWRKGLSIDRTVIPEMPAVLRDVLLQGSLHESFNKSFNKSFTPRAHAHARVANNVPNKNQDVHASPRVMTIDDAGLRKGRRDESIFHIAYQLAKADTPIQTIETVLKAVASACDPPYDPKKIPIKINSAISRAKNHDLNVSELVDQFLLMTDGDFLMTDVYTFMGLMTIADAEGRRKVQMATSQCFKRRIEEGVIEKASKKRGHYRKINTEIEFLDITKAKTEDVDIWLPLGIHKMIRVMPGNILAIAGAPDAGKTAFCLSTCRHNFKKMRVRYLSSEMGTEEARDRINEFDNIALGDWQKHWEFIECYDNYEDYLLKDRGSLTIIDYLEQPEGESWRAGHQLSQIHKKLGKGVCLVAIQKQRGARDTGYGGEATLQKPRFYMAMDFQRAKIIKAKIPNRDFGYCTGMECTFVLGSGQYFQIKKDWKK